MKKTQLDKEEQDLLAAFDSGKFQSELTPSRKKFVEASAAQTFKKDKRINIRISGRDLMAIQKRAMEEGIPYQTLMPVSFTNMLREAYMMLPLTTLQIRIRIAKRL